MSPYTLTKHTFSHVYAYLYNDMESSILILKYSSMNTYTGCYRMTEQSFSLYLGEKATYMLGDVLFFPISDL